MKRIVVPTDFSEHAGYALEAAAKLAKRFNAKLYLLHQLSLPANWGKLSTQERDALPQVEATKARFEDLRQQHPTLEIESHFTGGYLAEEIAVYVQKYGIDLIVMGSHGASGKRAYFIGSNTQKVARMVHCPLLVVKTPEVDINFDKVVFASSFNENDMPAFLKFKDFVKHFIPEIHLVAIHTSSLFDPPYIVSMEAMQQFKAKCTPFQCETHIQQNLSIDQGIRDFSAKIGAKLIGISNHYRHPVKRILAGSNVEALINHSDIPVLSIDYEKH